MKYFCTQIIITPTLLHTWTSSWHGNTATTAQEEVAQRLILGGAAVAISLPSSDQLTPHTEARGLEKFILTEAN